MHTYAVPTGLHNALLAYADTFCPLIMGAGRPRKVDPGALYAFAHQFYWDFRRIADGTVRWRFDAKKYQELTGHLDEIPLIDDEDRARHRRIVEDEIHMGNLDASKRDERLRDIEDSEVSARRMSYWQEASIEAQTEIKVPGECDVIDVLLDARTTPEQIRELCKEAVMTRWFETQPGVHKEVEVPAWPIPAGSTFPTYLSQYAEQYVAALRDPRFPRCDIATRPSNRLKQFWFLSRALAGALYGVTTRTAINLVGSLRPEEIFEESRSAKPERKRMRQKYRTRRTG
jgi:hypothetical protein